MKITVQGLGVLGGFGCGAAALAEGGGGAVPMTIPWNGGTREIPACRADTTPLERFIPKRALRRVDPFSRMALLGAHLALEDGGLPTHDLDGLGLIIASAYGATGTTFDLIDSMISDGDVCSSPIHFAGSLHNTPAAHLAIFLGATGPNLTLSLFEGMVPAALTAARLWLQEGRVDRVLVGMVDEVSDLTGYLWARHETGLPPGEGAVFFLLSSREDATGYGTLDEAEALPPMPMASLGALPAAPAFAMAAQLIKQDPSRKIPK